jgi:murein DD-endopeptidase MepM/ murein hydrolase activator NlpD
MKFNTLVFLFFAAFSSYSFSQSERNENKVAAENFEKNFNNENYQAIFDEFTKEMKDALPLNKTIEFLSSLKSYAGKISKREFVAYEIPYAVYKTKFERAVFTLKLSVDKDSKINGLFAEPYTESSAHVMKRNKTVMRLPFEGEWTVVWGGDTKELNYHVENNAQKNAFDFIITNQSGISYKTDGKTNEDYYAFGQKLFAPCAGEVVLVVDGIKDNTPGELNPFFTSGNTVIIKTDNNEFLFFAHFKQNSIIVKQGDEVSKGQLLGLCGNSGNSSEAHLHFHIQNIENVNIATGVKCYFEKVVVHGETKTDYSPIKNDKIKID